MSRRCSHSKSFQRDTPMKLASVSVNPEQPQSQYMLVLKSHETFHRLHCYCGKL